MYLDVFASRKEFIEWLLDEQENVCYLCGELFTRKNGPTIDHVRPLSRGGDWSVSNLMLAHRRCNLEKGDRIFLEDGTLEPRNQRKRKRHKHHRQNFRR